MLILLLCPYSSTRSCKFHLQKFRPSHCHTKGEVEQHIFLHVCSVSIVVRSFALQVSLTRHPSSLSSLLSPGQHGFPFHSSLVNPSSLPPLSLALLKFVYQGQKLHWHDPSSTGSCIAYHPPPGPYAFSPSASSSPPASIVCAYRQCHHAIVAAAFDCRCCPGHQHQSHHFWCSVLQLYFVWFTLASCWTMDLFGELCMVRDVGNRRRLSPTPWPCSQ